MAGVRAARTEVKIGHSGRDDRARKEQRKTGPRPTRPLDLSWLRRSPLESHNFVSGVTNRPGPLCLASKRPHHDCRTPFFCKCWRKGVTRTDFVSVEFAGVEDVCFGCDSIESCKCAKEGSCCVDLVSAESNANRGVQSERGRTRNELGTF